MKATVGGQGIDKAKLSSIQLNPDMLKKIYEDTKKEMRADSQTVQTQVEETKKVETTGQVLKGIEYGTQVYYAKPTIAQTHEVINQPEVVKQVVNQPVITQKIVSQPVIKQRVLQTPIIRKKEVSRPVYTEQVVNDPLVENKEVVNNVAVQVPGRQIYRERFVQPIQHIEQEVLNVKKG